MSFDEAKAFFQDAIETVDADHDATQWNLLSGLIKLSESFERLHSDVRSLQRKIDETSRDVKQVKNR
jgi:polyhydroxyalkanoate synthesis regulator phasin